MKIWKVEGSGNYASGLAIVSAKNPERAAKLAQGKSDWPGMKYEACDASEVSSLVPVEDREGVLVIFETGE
jgi:hypothetical protein